MIKRIAAITFIFICRALAWVILGATIFQLPAKCYCCHRQSSNIFGLGDWC